MLLIVLRHQPRRGCDGCVCGFVHQVGVTLGGLGGLVAQQCPDLRADIGRHEEAQKPSSESPRRLRALIEHGADDIRIVCRNGYRSLPQWEGILSPRGSPVAVVSQRG